MYISRGDISGLSCFRTYHHQVPSCLTQSCWAPLLPSSFHLLDDGLSLTQSFLRELVMYAQQERRHGRETWSSHLKALMVELFHYLVRGASWARDPRCSVDLWEHQSLSHWAVLMREGEPLTALCFVSTLNQLGLYAGCFLVLTIH